jgi:hypothetical protein
MPLWNWLKTLWRNLARKRMVEDDLDDEIRAYQDMLEDEKARAGADPCVARREALIELGGVEHIKEEVRDVRLGATLEAMRTELRQSLRGLRRNPGLTVLGAVMVALGIGASTVVFSIFHAALLQPLPFRDSDRVVQLWETRLDRGFSQMTFTQANFWDVRAQNHAFDEVAALHYNQANLTGAGPAEKVQLISITAGFFRTLGVSPVLGRDFSYEDDRGGWDNRVVIVGIDIGNAARYTAVPPDLDQESVRTFECFTEDLHKRAICLEECGIVTVAMQSTVIYWLPVYETV